MVKEMEGRVLEKRTLNMGSFRKEGKDPLMIAKTG
jgi:hypothetical protein